MISSNFSLFILSTFDYSFSIICLKLSVNFTFSSSSFNSHLRLHLHIQLISRIISRYYESLFLEKKKTINLFNFLLCHNHIINITHITTHPSREEAWISLFSQIYLHTSKPSTLIFAHFNFFFKSLCFLVSWIIHVIKQRPTSRIPSSIYKKVNRNLTKS